MSTPTNSLLQPGETLGAPVSAPAPSPTQQSAQPDSSSLLQPGETLGAPVSASQQPSTGVASRAWQATKDETGNIVQGVAAPISAAITPPQTAREHAVSAIAGPGALVAYRASQSMVDAAENFFKAKKENINQAAKDLARATYEFHNRDYRSGLADTASSVAGVMGIAGDPLPEMGRAREILQGTKPGGDVVTPLTKDVVDLGAAALAEKAPEIGGAAKETAGSLKKIIPSTERAGQTMENLRQAIGTHPVEMTDELSKAASRVQELADNGNTMPSAARKFLNRITDPEKGHLTYNEARDFMTKFGNMTADEQTKIAPAMKGQMQQLGGALKDAVEGTAARGGKLEEFQNSMREYSRAKTLQKAMDIVKEYGTKAAITGAAGATGVAVYEKLKSLFE